MKRWSAVLTLCLCWLTLPLSLSLSCDSCDSTRFHESQDCYFIFTFSFCLQDDVGSAGIRSIEVLCHLALVVLKGLDELTWAWMLPIADLLLSHNHTIMHHTSSLLLHITHWCFLFLLFWCTTTTTATKCSSQPAASPHTHTLTLCCIYIYIYSFFYLLLLILLLI